MTDARKARKVRCIETGEVYNSCREAGRKLGLSESAVARIIRGVQESTKGLHFEAVEENIQEVEVLPSTIQNEQGETVPVIDSREVARMMGVPHWDILCYIEGSNGKTGILPTLLTNELGSIDYFIESSYTTTHNKRERCYLCTRMGCDLLATRQVGEKGILFCAKYVEKFNEMEKELKEKQQPKQMSDDEIIAKALFLLNGKYEQAIAELTQAKAELTEKTEFIDDINDCYTFTQVSQYNKQLLRDRKDIVLSTAKLNEVAAELGIPVNKIDNPIVYSPYRRVNAYPRKVWMTAYPDIKLPEKENK